MVQFLPTGIRRAGVAVLVAATLLGFEVSSATAADVAPAGQYQGPSFSGGPSSPTGSKPESKLWFADGSWWSVMNVGGTGLRIYRLDPSSQAWQATGVVVDSRNTVRSDVLFDGTKLYVATHVFSESPATGSPSNLYRFSYDAGTDTYSLDPGFPALINTWRTETLVLAKDSTGQLWATWTQQSQVMVNRTLASDAVWGIPFVLPGGTGLSSDDISSVVAFAGRIGIMWSDQSDDQMRFATHDDSAIDDAVWSGIEVAVSGSNMADDHINLKADSSTGRVYAATKTSASSDSQPFNILSIRAAGGGWTTKVFGTKADNHTRPIVVLNEEKRRLYYFATWDQSGDVIYMKETSLDDPSFGPGRGTAVIDAADVNNATASKQPVSEATGLVVQATADETDLYWHYWNPLTK